jgi:hypothetical protein
MTFVNRASEETVIPHLSGLLAADWGLVQWILMF